MHRLIPALFLLALPAGARAQADAAAPVPPAPKHIVVLEIRNDTRGALRDQVLDALTQAKQVDLLLLRKWEDAADLKGIHPDNYAAAETIQILAPYLGLAAVIGGEVQGDQYAIVIFDSRGERLWSKELPLVKGKLTAENAKRLAAAIAVAAEEAATPPPPAVEMPPPPVVVVIGPPPPPPPGPQWLRIGLTGTTTWRDYCSRPGVQSCKEWDDLVDGTEPLGETQTFRSPTPYLGLAVSGEFFPFAKDDAWWKGFGLRGDFATAVSLTTVTISTPNSTTPGRTVTSLDFQYAADAVYRRYFAIGGLAAFGGGHAGFRGHDFFVDPSAGTLLSGSHRLFPAAGIEGGVALAKLAKVEIGGSYFISPRAGRDEVSKYGTAVRSLGFEADAALTGDITGIWGYALRFHLELYNDRFTGAGTRWAEGGVAQETYATLYWGVTAAF